MSPPCYFPSFFRGVFPPHDRREFHTIEIPPHSQMHFSFLLSVLSMSLPLTFCRSPPGSALPRPSPLAESPPHHLRSLSLFRPRRIFLPALPPFSLAPACRPPGKDTSVSTFLVKFLFPSFFQKVNEDFGFSSRSTSESFPPFSNRAVPYLKSSFSFLEKRSYLPFSLFKT